MSRILFIIRFIPIYHITNKRPYILNLFFQIYMQMENDQSWVYKSGDVLAHFNGVSLFLETVVQHAIRQKEEAIYCPCRICNNNVMYLIKDCELIHEHLVWIGFMDIYFIWSKPGETTSRIENIIDETQPRIDHACSHHHDDGFVDDVGQDDIGQDDAGQSDEGIDVEELMHNVAHVVLLQRRNKGFDNFETLDKASKDLYEECKWCDKKHTVLWMMIQLLKLNASNGWSDTSFSDLLQLLTKVLPKPNGLANNTYLAKKISCPLTLGVEKIHACPNHGILYQKEHEFKEKCPTCNASRYKRNNDDSEGQGRKRKNNATLDQDI
jgi:hypothetical protein